MQGNNTSRRASNQSALDFKFIVTWFPDQRASTKREVEISLRQLQREIQTLRAAEKSKLPWFKAMSFGNRKSEKNCLRTNNNALLAYGIEGDHDTGTMTPEEARRLLEEAGILALIYTTPSHYLGGNGPRWRVICVFSKPLDPIARAGHVARLNGILKGVLAKESFAVSQAFFAGKVEGGKSVQSFLIEGDFIDLRPDLDAGAIQKAGGEAGASALDEKAALRAIKAGVSFHPNIIALAGKWATQDVTYMETRQRLFAAMETIPEEDRDSRWAERVADIPRILTFVYGNRAAERASKEREEWQVDFDMCWVIQHPDGEEPEVEDALAGYELDQDGIIRAFTDRHRGELLFDHHSGCWFHFNGFYWVREETKLANDYARKVSTDMARRDPRAKPLKNVPTWEAVERGARTVRDLSCSANTWNTDPMLLGTPRGTVDLRTGRLRPALPGDHISKITAVAPIALDSFDPARDCPQWLRFLDQALAGDAGAIRFLQQWGGYCLTGDTREQVLLFVYGEGGSGKSTATNTIMAILHDYAVSVATSTLTASKYQAHPEEIARLHGPRMAVASETEKNSKWAENRIKSLTGQDKLTARYMRENSFDFYPQFKLTIFGNNAPSLSNVDSAMRRRFMILPFKNPPAKKDATLGERLKAEWPGILSWLMLGCLDWQANGLVRPAVLEQATSTYFAEQDTFGQWLDEKCVRTPGKAATVEALFVSWQGYALQAGEDPGSKNKSFPEALQQAGFELVRDRGGIRGRGVMGLRLATVEDDFTDDMV